MRNHRAGRIAKANNAAANRLMKERVREGVSTQHHKGNDRISALAGASLGRVNSQAITHNARMKVRHGDYESSFQNRPHSDTPTMLSPNIQATPLSVQRGSSRSLCPPGGVAGGSPLPIGCTPFSMLLNFTPREYGPQERFTRGPAAQAAANRLLRTRVQGGVGGGVSNDPAYPRILYCLLHRFISFHG